MNIIKGKIIKKLTSEYEVHTDLGSLIILQVKKLVSIDLRFEIKELQKIFSDFDEIEQIRKGVLFDNQNRKYILNNNVIEILLKKKEY